MRPEGELARSIVEEEVQKVGKEKPGRYLCRCHFRRGDHHHHRRGSPKCRKEGCERHEQTRKNPRKDRRKGRTRTRRPFEPGRRSFETGSEGHRAPFGKPLAPLEKKSAGLHNIPNRLLKIAAEVVAPSLTKIFIQSINTRIFPEEWKEARVSPLYKTGAKNDPSNYRPISVIPTVSKLYEKMTYDQLYHYLNTYNLLTHCQSGFRSFHSTLNSIA